MKDRLVLMGGFWLLTLVAYIILPYCSTELEVTYLDPKKQEGEFIVSDAGQVAFYFLLLSAGSLITTAWVIIGVPAFIRTSRITHDERKQP